MPTRRYLVLGLAGMLIACASPATKAVKEKTVAYVPPGSTAAPSLKPTVLPTINHSLPTLAPPATPAPASPAYTVTTLVGASAGLNHPTGLAIAPDGTLVVADHNNHAIRRIDPKTGQVSLIAGGTTAGYADGDASSAEFSGPSAVAVDARGTIYVAEGGNHRVRQIANGQVTTIAGNGSGSAQVGPGASAGFIQPAGLALDGKNGLYLIDSADNRIDRIDLASDQHVVTSLAGNGQAASRDGQGTSASFNSPFGVAADAQGNALVADPGNHRIRKVSPDGSVTTVPMGATEGSVIFQPVGIAVRKDGTMIVTDVGNRRVLAIPQATGTAQPDTRLVAGSDGTFDTPQAVAVAADGRIYVADSEHDAIVVLTPAGAADQAATP